MRRWLPLALAAAAACATGPRRPAEPTSMTSAAIVAKFHLRSRTLPNLIGYKAKSVHYARLRPDGSPDMDLVYETQFASDGYVFLLDVPPGRYCPVAVAYFRHGVRYMAKLDDYTSRAEWAVDAVPGRLAYGGHNSVSMLPGDLWEELVIFAKHAASWIPPWLYKPTIEMRYAAPRGDRTPRGHAEALHDARRILAGTQWTAFVEVGLEAVGRPPAPLETGLIRKKAVLPRREGRFGYVDELEWGEPRKVAGGLEWREPKGRARLGVVFMTPKMEGWREPEAFLEAMRLAGSPEDRHVVDTVVVSSRTAHVARWTTYDYAKDSLAGVDQKVNVTETWVVPEPDGMHVARFRAPREHFERLYPRFRRFASYWIFYPPSEEPKP